MQQSFQVWASKRCGRHAYSFARHEKRYTRRTDKRFHGQDIMFTTRNAPATPCPEDRMSRGEKLRAGRIYERRQIGSSLSTEAWKRSCIPRYGPLCHGLRGISHFEHAGQCNVSLCARFRPFVHFYEAPFIISPDPFLLGRKRALKGIFLAFTRRR